MPLRFGHCCCCYHFFVFVFCVSFFFLFNLFIHFFMLFFFRNRIRAHFFSFKIVFFLCLSVSPSLSSLSTTNRACVLFGGGNLCERKIKRFSRAMAKHEKQTRIHTLTHKSAIKGTKENTKKKHNKNRGIILFAIPQSNQKLLSVLSRENEYNICISLKYIEPFEGPLKINSKRTNKSKKGWKFLHTHVNGI